MPVFEIERDGKTYEVEAPDMQSAVKGFSQFKPNANQSPQASQQSQSRPQPLVPSGRDKQLPPDLQREVNQDFERRIAKTGPIGRAIGGAGAAFAENASLGSSNHLEAAIKSLLPTGPSRFLDYGNNLEMVRQRNDIQKDAAPISKTVGGLIGAVGGAGRLMKEGVTAVGKTGKGLLGTTLGVGIDSAALAGTHAALDGRNPLEEAKQGGLLGAGANLVFRGAAPIAGALRRAPKSTTTEAIKDQASKAYAQSEGFGSTFSPAQLQGLTDDISKLVPQGGLGGVDRVSHPTIARALEKLQANSGKGATLSDLDKFRQTLSGSPLNKPDARLSSKARKALDKFTANTIPASTAQGTGQEANAALLNARALHRRGLKSSALDEVENRIKASSGFIGGKKDEAIRGALRSVINSKKQRRQFDGPEIDAMRKIVEGSKRGNLARKSAQTLNPFEGRQNIQISGLGYAFSPAVTGVLNSVGFGSRTAINRLTSRDYKELAAAIRNNTGQNMHQGQIEELLRNPETRAALSNSLGIMAGAN